MSSVAFHFNVSDRFDYVGRLARKAVATAARTVVVADADALPQLDRTLWLLPGTEFLAHCDGTAVAGMLARSPIVLTPTLRPELCGDVLINLSETVPPGYAAFDRVIELVGVLDQERSAARQRWRQYVADGLQPVYHDAQNRTPLAL
ncbi:MAG: DNA polymerase III subunit chi [Rhodoferax sp.]|nr:DNA polymerase III subunit chi [Rhodoferax sp.]